MRCKGVICFLVMVCILHDTAMAQQPTAFQQDMDQWKQKRINALKAPNGWLNLTGLFWLQPGKNDFGAASGNAFVYKHPDMPEHAGYFLWENGTVQWFSAKGVAVRINDTIRSGQQVFELGKSGSATLALGSLRFNIIQRENKIGVRLRDLNALLVKTFKGTARFKDDSSWRLKARLEKADEGRLMITNVLGQTNAQQSPGKLVFYIAGTEYKLDALVEDDQLFILFGDATSGKQTYPAGRFVYADLPDASGNTILDFNKAYNPPCAFTKYATCPLPPAQNILPIAITAGEKNYHFK